MDLQNSSSRSSSGSSNNDNNGGNRKSVEIRRMWEETKKVWAIAGPAIVMAVSQYSLDFVTTAFVGKLGSLQLAAVSVVHNVLKGFAYGFFLGMGSALETLCGQAVGAGHFDMLGIYLQRSWIITLVTSLLLTPTYLFTSPILRLLHQDKRISDLAGKYALWATPQLFAYAINFPVQKFLQSQSKVWVMTVMSAIVLGIHVVLNWVVLVKSSYGVVGAAMVGNFSWFLLITGQLIYVMCGFFPEAWTGFSWLAFRSLKGFVKLTLASAVMLCLELWYFTIVILMVGWLKNPEVPVDAYSICMNINIWTLMVALGFNAAISVRVSNELGAGQPRAAKHSVVIATFTSITIVSMFTVMLLLLKDHYPKMFTNRLPVITEASRLSYFLASAIFLNGIQSVLQGVAVGAGWQFIVAVLNLGCYYLIGLPAGAVLGYKFKLGIHGIWGGLLAGVVLQTLILVFIVWRTNWKNEASQAKTRMKIWGGSGGSADAPST